MTLVSVGIPTFNRAAGLRRAAESVLGQTHAELELVISDNASDDDTQAVCAELCARDPRVRYLRHEVNRGPTANFNTLYATVSGEYAMVLSDDDWLEPDYIERCLGALVADPRRALVCGRARYHDGEQVVSLGVPFTLDDADPARRVLGYVGSVDQNGLFYGLSRTDRLRAAGPLRNVLGNDWLVVAGLLAMGTAATLETTAINREGGGTSADTRRLTATLGLPRAQAYLPTLVMAWQVFAEILWRGRAFRSLGARARTGLAASAALRVLDWRSDLWHLTAPAAAALGRRRWGAPLWRAYLALTRRLGATHDRLPE